MFSKFSHYLAYGSTDQETLRELTDEYNGLLVPGTVAAYQAEGTRGFVLTLSASVQQPYTIDPRMPLFQYHNSSPKQSHLALAKVLNLDAVISNFGMVPNAGWTRELCNRVVSAWIDFNSDYTQIAPRQFQKYARRLGKKLSTNAARVPDFILVPYLMHTPDFDTRVINDELWHEALKEAGKEQHRLRRVVAASDSVDLVKDALSSGQEEIALWMDNLDEVDPTNASRLAQYASAVSEISAAGIQPFAMYGGYFSVALGSVGLAGSSHGVGFSEHRNHIELKSSGGAPARYYMQRLHRYLPIDIASEVWRQRPDLTEARYLGYTNRDPGEYSYHELMKHSVRSRQNEISQVSGRNAIDLANEIRKDYHDLQRGFSSLAVSTPVYRRLEGYLAHLPGWANALEHVSNS